MSLTFSVWRAFRQGRWRGPGGGLGMEGDGDFYFSSNKSDAGDVLYLIEMAKKKLMEICDGRK